ncbi:hypothetical protein ABD87_14945 [Lysinibacillus sphaericus]|uniref:hypothetical protein n=1 Tax=Lysinibacillus sphaericus TaxID=1421 RepID=UPI0018CD201B|nr:hypothetical protein [Lysinibacillus sphaericus]MBG9730791.1 hypothetical protein [Lysinibacillus sphaericus]
MIQEKTIQEIFADIKVSEHRYGCLELNDYPIELLNRVKKLFSKIDSFEPFDDLTDNEGVFLGKQGYERLEKVVHHLNEIEKIISPHEVEEIVENNENELNIYEISTHYSSDVDDNKDSVFVETSMGLESFVKTIAAINFKFEELVDFSEFIDKRHLVEILEKFFDVRNKTQVYQKHAPFTCMEKRVWKLGKTFKVAESEKNLITLMDLYSARESNCGDGYEKLLKDYLPNSIEFESEVKNLRDFYPWITNK